MHCVPKDDHGTHWVTEDGFHSFLRLYAPAETIERGNLIHTFTNLLFQFFVNF